MINENDPPSRHSMGTLLFVFHLSLFLNNKAARITKSEIIVAQEPNMIFATFEYKSARITKRIPIVGLLEQEIGRLPLNAIILLDEINQ